MTSTRTKLAFAGLGVLVMVLAALVPTGSADVHDRFGDQVVFGDADYIPTLDTTEDLKACVVTFGETNPGEFAYYLKAPHNVGSGSEGDVQRDDLRLREYDGQGMSTLVRDSHTVEIGQTCENTLTEAHVVFGDVNNNNRYDADDYVWLTSDAGDDFVSSSDKDTWTLRLTDNSGGNAGSLVFAGDSDHLDYGSNSVELTNGAGTIQIGFTNVNSAETSGGAPRFTSGDHLYIAVPYQDGTATVGDLAPLHSIRLHGPGGAFGSQVGPGDGDFIPLLNEEGTLADGDICVADLEGDDNIDDYGVYLHLNTAAHGDEVVVNMLRLVATSDGEPGSLVRSSHFAEIGLDCESTITPAGYEILYADVNNNGRYDGGDHVFISTDADLEATSATSAWTIRLTDTGSGNPGTFMFTGDSDLTSWRGDVSNFELGDGFGIMDLDRSGTTDSDRIMTRGDPIYLMRGADAGTADSLAPVYSIRLHEGEFGTQVALGDSDFRPSLEVRAFSVCVALLGDDIQDFGFYLQEATPATVQRHAVRLVEAEGNPPGSTVRTSDTIEVGQDCEGGALTIDSGDAILDTVSIHYTDLNNNGRYDEGDELYLSYLEDGATTAADKNVVSSNSETQWSIRLSGGNAGTLVFSGDSDLVTYRNNAPNLAASEVHFFDQDLRDEFSRGDTMYISPVAIGGQELVTIHSVRVTGELPTGGPIDEEEEVEVEEEAEGEEVEEEAEGEEVEEEAEGEEAEGEEVEEEDDDDEEEPTPAPAAMLVIAALGAALVALRRRK